MKILKTKLQDSVLTFSGDLNLAVIEGARGTEPQHSGVD